MRICPKCGAENRDDAKFCEMCGAKLFTPDEDHPLPEVEIPKARTPAKPKIELVLPGHEYYEEAEEEEEDLADILSPNNGVETHGNMQAATMPKIELVIPEESELQKKAKAELDRELEERRKRREEPQSVITPREEYSSLSRPEEKKDAPLAASLPKFEKENKESVLSASRPQYERTEERKETVRPSVSSHLDFDTDIYEGDVKYGVISYITWLGLLFSWYKTKDMQSDYMKNHLNNSLYLHLAALIVTTLLSKLSVGWILDLLITIMWIICMFTAGKGEERELPVISELPKIL